MPGYTRRLIIIARSGENGRGNTAAKQVDVAGGERTFTVPLARPANPTVPVAYWCSWAMQPGDVTAIRARLRAQGYTADEVAGARRGDAHDAKRVAVFDAAEWTPDEVLAALNLRRLPAAVGG